MGPTWGPPGSCRPQMGPILAPWTLLSRKDPQKSPMNYASRVSFIHLFMDAIKWSATQMKLMTRVTLYRFRLIWLKSGGCFCKESPVVMVGDLGSHMFFLNTISPFNIRRNKWQKLSSNPWSEVDICLQDWRPLLIIVLCNGLRCSKHNENMNRAKP